MKAEPFPLDSVCLLDGPFQAAIERNGKYLLALKPDWLLHSFRKFAGLEPKAPIYGAGNRGESRAIRWGTTCRHAP